MSSQPSARSRVFISYSHHDIPWLERLQTYLKPLERTGVIDRWDDTRIQGGMPWRDEINRALESARVAVLLVSPHFLASDFIVQEELPSLLKRAEKDGVLILPVLVSPSRFDRTPSLSRFQAAKLPTMPLMPLSGMTEHDQGALLVHVANTIEDALAGSFERGDPASSDRKRSDAMSEQNSRTAESELAHMIRAAEDGDVNAQYELAVRYESGSSVAKDDAESAKWFRRAAEQGLAKAQTKLGLMFSNGRGVAEDQIEAVKWFRDAIGQGDADAQYYMAWMYLKGLGVPTDRTEAVRLFRRAGEQGHLFAQVQLASTLRNGVGINKDDAEAVKWSRKAAEQGHVDSQVLLGKAYQDGTGVTKDEAESVTWYRKAADQGSLAGQLSLALAYDKGRGVARNEAEAANWYRMAAEQWHRKASTGDAKAQYTLGHMYEHGMGVPKDESEAMRWYREAAALGNLDAQFRLSWLHKLTVWVANMAELLRKGGRA